MKKFLTYLILAFLSGSLSFTAIAQETDIDDGYNKLGRLVVAPTLIKICGLSSKAPSITEECYKKLAKHYREGKTGDYEFPTYESERAAIFNDYASAYLKEASVEMKDSGAHEEELDKKVGKDPNSSPSLNTDRRQFWENNIAIASANTARILFAAATRSQAIKTQNIQQALNYLIPEMKDDLDNEDADKKANAENTAAQ